eukprot:scpid100544/ scgid12188/ 
MLRQVFTEEIEAKLIQLWGEYVKNKSGTMVRRSVKEKEIGEALTRFARQLDNTDVEFTASVVHHKIDNLKAKAKEHYKKYRKMTATGSPAGDAGDDAAYDLTAAYATWTNFRTWHGIFKDVPGFGPLQSICSATIVHLGSQSQAAAPPQAVAANQHLTFQSTPMRIASSSAAVCATSRSEPVHHRATADSDTDDEDRRNLDMLLFGSS